MDNQYNLYNFEALFKKFLLAENVSLPTLKNYLSDFRHFGGWWIFKLKVQNVQLNVEEGQQIQLVSRITSDLVEEYKMYLIQNNLPVSTINRRLSTVRKFCSFCISQGWMKENPAKKIANFQSENTKNLLKEFENDIAKEGENEKTVKHIVADITEFLQVINSTNV